MKYEIAGFHKSAKLDNWENGRQLQGGYYTYFDYSIKADTKEILDEKLKAFFGSEAGIEYNSCEEEGRIDIQRTENAEGDEPNNRELSDWKAGIIDLYAVTYTAYCVSVSRIPAEF